MEEVRPPSTKCADTRSTWTEEGKAYVEEMRKNAQVTETGKATVAPTTTEKPTEEGK